MAGGQLKHGDGLFLADGWKLPQKLVERLAVRKEVKESLNGNPRASETRRAVHRLRINLDGAHGFILCLDRGTSSRLGGNPRRRVATE